LAVNAMLSGMDCDITGCGFPSGSGFDAVLGVDEGAPADGVSLFAGALFAGVVPPGPGVF
jgi:hypothetical protein